MYNSGYSNNLFSQYGLKSRSYKYTNSNGDFFFKNAKHFPFSTNHYFETRNYITIRKNISI